VPEFRARIDFAQGSAETLQDTARRGAFRASDDDYERVVQEALALGFETEEL
jgi:hypothetical protein